MFSSYSDEYWKAHEKKRKPIKLYSLIGAAVFVILCFLIFWMYRTLSIPSDISQIQYNITETDIRICTSTGTVLVKEDYCSLLCRESRLKKSQF